MEINYLRLENWEYKKSKSIANCLKSNLISLQSVLSLMTFRSSAKPLPGVEESRKMRLNDRWIWQRGFSWTHPSCCLPPGMLNDIFMTEEKSVSPTRAPLIFDCLHEHIPIGCDHVSDAVEWEHESHPDKLESLGENVHPAPSGQTLVPDGRQ